MTFRKQIVFFAGGLALAAAVGLIPRQAGSLPPGAPSSVPAPACAADCGTSGPVSEIAKV